MPFGRCAVLDARPLVRDNSILPTDQSHHLELKRMARSPRRAKAKPAEPAANGNGNGAMALVKELWQAAVNLRGSIEPADYKRYVLPIIFLRFLSLRFERRREQLEKLIADPKSEYHGDRRALSEPDEYRSAGAFLVPEAARWDTIVKNAQADDIKVQLDNILELLENKYPGKLKGLLPRIYAGSNSTPRMCAG
jgi:type I restriction enzyme M protein